MRTWLRFRQRASRRHVYSASGIAFALRSRPSVEGLEERCLLAAPVLDLIPGQITPFGKTVQVPVTASDADGDALTYSVTSSNPQFTATLHTGTFLKLTVANFGVLQFELFDDVAPKTIATIKGL